MIPTVLGSGIFRSISTVVAWSCGLTFDIKEDIIGTSTGSSGRVIGQTKRIIYRKADIHPFDILHRAIFLHSRTGATKGDVERSEAIYFHLVPLSEDFL